MAQFHTTDFSNPANDLVGFPIGALAGGADPYARSLEAKWQVGMTVLSTDNKSWRYVKAGATPLAAAATVSVPAAIAASAAGVASAGTGFMAYAPFKANEYGWVKSNAVALA
jgi:hypothetical protein